MTPTKKPSSLPFDPAWLALGLAALVLIGTAVWLIAVRSPARPEAAAAAAQVSATAPPAVVAPLAQRLAALEARPEANAVVEDRMVALGQALEARFGGLAQRQAETAGQLTRLETAAGTAYREMGDALGGRIALLDAALAAQLGATQQRLAAQDATLQALTARLAEATGPQRTEAAARQAGEAALAAVQPRLDALDQSLRGVTEGMQRAQEATRQASEAAAAAQRQRLDSQDQAMRTATEGLQRAQAAVTAALRTAEEALNQRIAAQDARLAPLEEASRRLGEAAARTARAAALEAVRGLLDAGRPLGAALTPEAPPALARFATVAPPSEAALRLSFEDAARTARGAGTPDTALGRLGSVLTIRRGDEVVFGDAGEATVERARRALEAGDLDGAVNQLSRLPEPARNAMRPWLNDAEALVAARAALRQLAGN